MKLSIRLPLTCAGLALVTLAAGLWGLWRMTDAVAAFEAALAKEVAHERAAADIQIHFKTQVQEWKNVLLRSKDEAAGARHWKAFVDEEAQVARQAKALAEALPAGPQRDSAERFVSAHAAMAQAYRKGYAAFREAQVDSAVGDRAVRGIDREPSKQLDALAQLLADAAAQQAVAAHAMRDRALAASLAGMLLALVSAVACGVWLSRSIRQPLDDAVTVARAVAAGRLGHQVPVRGDEELRELLQSLQAMSDELVRVVSQVRSGSDAVAIGSDQVAAGSTHLSQRTEGQAASIEQTASAMDQLASSAGQSESAARRVSQLAGSANQAASDGGEVVRKMASLMQGIADSSRQVSDIVGTIDGIAFQTNILALNAAVEAARAGEQGRGFAVVAAEVRALAQRSSAAAREIRGLVGSSVEQMTGGAMLAAQAREAIDGVIEQVREVSSLMDSISGTAGEQTRGISQVHAAMSELEQTTQQNTALVQESSAAARSLSDQARSLQQAVQRFSIEGSPA